jgi:hypothetical protein
MKPLLNSVISPVPTPPFRASPSPAAAASSSELPPLTEVPLRLRYAWTFTATASKFPFTRHVLFECVAEVNVTGIAPPLPHPQAFDLPA